MKLRHLLTALLATALTTALVTTSCSSADDGGGEGAVDDVLGDPGDCIVVEMSVSSEKIELLTDLAVTFNESEDATVDGECVFVRPQSKASGGAMDLLLNGWDENTEGPRPVIWSPAASAWGSILNQRLADDGREAMVPDESSQFMLTPLVIAMPEPMVEALGYPDTPIGWADIFALATDPQGWASVGHPEWGPFRLGKTNPNFSTSGLNALIAQTYAATGKTDGLTLEDLSDPEVQAFAEGIESAVVHYGDITMTFLNNWYRADQRGTALTYASAVAVEEKSVIDYNQGNPDGVLDPGEEARPPKIPLVAIYPTEGTLYSDNPFFILEADWVDQQQAEAARLFEEFVQEPENQERVLEFGFRPGNPEVAIGAPVDESNGVDPNQPQTLLQVPEPPVLVQLLENWDEQRKDARVLIVLDVSGSMGDEAQPGSGETKLELAKAAAIEALDEFKDDDIVGLRVFTDQMGWEGNYLDLVEPGRIGDVREQLKNEIRGLQPLNGTPLYEVSGESFEQMVADYDPARINAIILLSDGVNDDGDRTDDPQQYQDLLTLLEDTTQGENSVPVRVFPIAYGADADLAALRGIAEASNAAVYDASDPATINKVFTAVVSNF